MKLGFEHILDGTDHLLFLFCLVIPFRRFRSLVAIVTAFTVAHSITLIASAYDLGARRALVPAADRDADRHVDRLHGAREHRRRRTSHRRWLITFGVRPRARLRLFVRAAADAAVRRLAPADVAAVVQRRRRARTTAGAAAADPGARSALQARRRGADGHDHPVGARRAHRLALDDGSRTRQFRQYDLSLPEFTPAFIAELLRYAMFLVALAGILWVVSLFMKRREESEATS